MSRMIFLSLPVADLPASIAFYAALGLRHGPAFSNGESACMVWSPAAMPPAG